MSAAIDEAADPYADVSPCEVCVQQGANPLDRGELENCARSHGASRPPFGGDACPACGRESIYVRQLDRFLHVDGGENDTCWYLILVGRAGW